MARHIVASAFLSLDGVMQAPGGPTEDPTGGFDQGGWVFSVWDEGVEATLGTLFAGDYDLLLGRRTYDIFAAYWPYAEGDNAPMRDAFNAANKYVLTRGDRPLDWENSHRVSSVEDVAALKAGDGPKMIIQGSSTLYPALLAAGLIDELITMTYPVIIGAGKRIFGEGTPVAALTMTDHRVTAKGTVIASYAPGGALPPYPSEAPIPIISERELARQARIEAGSW
ncbi:dihydrofolate reductase [Erythromicrobium ramosum]|uniref:Dihydrofolate reductase n=1 Tax=Erythrobacter ramosus TaxID=35811 RepID=A0A6I4UIS4_9SPHN|nr:dihydrofolate reductase family protein [Erythrobacter ramosus]MBB3776537.1 dihydrofolate reductase [Erythrobacter ramosus]MXP38386.1 dihydrofolate reductase [Erythrobacter ramosus]